MLVFTGNGGAKTFNGYVGISKHVLASKHCTGGIETSSRDDHKLGVACLGICFVQWRTCASRVNRLGGKCPIRRRSLIEPFTISYVGRAESFDKAGQQTSMDVYKHAISTTTSNATTTNLDECTTRFAPLGIGRDRVSERILSALKQ